MRMSDFSISASVGQASTQAPHDTHSEARNVWFWLGETFELKPRPWIVRANVPCTSSQARTQREQTMQERVRWREPGMFQKTFVERVAELDALLDAANLEEFTVTNHDRPVSDVAIEMLSRAGWICPNTEPSDR